MSAKRAERLVNLVIALLGTRQFVTAARIRATVPGYEADDGTERADEAFKRMFERDKAELRELGRPAGDRPDQRRSTPRTATGSPAPTTSCPRSP